MENKCSTQSGCCETESQTCSTTQAQECCPVETAVGMWSGAFCDAMHEVQVDLLKAKIQKAWGNQMDKVADAVVEAMGIKWQSLVATGKAQADLREKIKHVWSESKK